MHLASKHCSIYRIFLSVHLKSIGKHRESCLSIILLKWDAIEKRHARFFEKPTAARRGIIKFLCANEIIREAVEMNGQESRTCRVAAFVSIDWNAFVIRREASSRGPTAAKRKWRKKSEGGWTGRRSPLTSRQSGPAEVSMTPVRRRSADAARRDQRGSPRRAPPLKRRDRYYGSFVRFGVKI